VTIRIPRRRLIQQIANVAASSRAKGAFYICVFPALDEQPAVRINSAVKFIDSA